MIVHKLNATNTIIIILYNDMYYILIYLVTQK